MNSTNNDRKRSDSKMINQPIAPSNTALTDDEGSLRARINRVFHRVKNHFIEKSDRTEHWQMPPPGYTGEQWLRDDCDGFCLACRALLRQQGIPSRLVYCEINAGSGHLVVEVQGWILDNRQRTVVPNKLLDNYRWRRISGFEAGDPWREIIG